MGIDMNNISLNEMNSILKAANFYTKDHFKLLKQDDRKTLLAIIHNLSNPNEGIPLTRKQLINLKGSIEKINSPKEKIQRFSSLKKRTARIFKNLFLGRVSSAKLNKELNALTPSKRNTYLDEHRFTVASSTHFEKNVKRLWKSVNEGNQPIIAKGACESRIYTFKDNKAIYKDISPKDLSMKRTMEITLKQLLGITRPTELLPGKAQESKGFAEKLAYDLDQYLGLGLVPETNFINKPLGPHLEGYAGTLQLFLKPSYKEAREVFSVPLHQPNISELDLFQTFILFDYLIGNLDRHEENWMVELSEDGRLIGIGAIDNGNSFIEKNPKADDKTILKNQYRWGEHPYSTHPFTDGAKAFINGIDEEQLLAFIYSKKEELIKHPHTETFFSGEMIQNTLERLHVMKKIVNQEGATPQTLAEIKTSKAIKRCLGG